MKTTINETDGKYVITIEGRFDTAAADQASKDLSMFNENTGHDITIDAKGLEYISSSGLRILLNLRKHAAGNRVTIVNLSDDVLHIFKMTGFNNLFIIE
jgi:anti-anti-sigma factor